MSDLSATVHRLQDLFAGKINFSQFRDGEAALIQQNIASLPPAAQGAATLALDSLKAGASALVGIGQTAVGPILADTTDHQTTMVLNLLSSVGLNPGGVLTIAEQAVVSQLITGLKTGLDRIGLQITTSGVHAAPAPAPAPTSGQG